VWSLPAGNCLEDVLELLMDCSWIAHGLLMDCLWIAYGLLMDCSWIAHGLLMDCSWIAHGLLMDCSRIAHGLLMDCSWICSWTYSSTGLISIASDQCPLGSPVECPHLSELFFSLYKCEEANQ
jgi:hypothetical protein